ncbi:hypothetical protein [Magnetospirillum sulfuroxidans]|uniref:Uncharacterized protein n=1 Tax=Magnetospirillum sulfuroxidans TaxID=611300 RepID=A0ABS5IIT6_9PROT|nr:hypothetical protein [Magnetospirillum sulfuroxidans]MBR9973688.1 hypothetical protein [Magnetospirillum sulfuroxidans]
MAYRMIMAKGSLDAPKTWELLSQTLKSYDCLPDILLASGTPHKNDLKKYFRSRPDCINVETGMHRILSNPLGHYHFIQTLFDEKQQGPNLWEDTAMSFSSIQGFRQAFIYDLDYDLWQNTSSIQSYQLKGRDYSHLPLRHNRLPPPLDEMEIDTRNNPGRYVFRQGYLEAVGSTMWLGDDFFKLVGAHRRDALLAADWADVRDVAPGVLRVQVAPEPFCDDSTADLQN